MRLVDRIFRLSPVLLLLGASSLGHLFANVSTTGYPLRVKVIRIETKARDTQTPVPKDCDLQNYSAYCNESNNPGAENIMIVQDNEGRSLQIQCNSDARWSKCSLLSVGETYDAREEKHRLAILYRTAKGKEKKRSFQLVANASEPRQASVPVPPPPPAAPLPQNPPAPVVASPLPSPSPVAPSVAPAPEIAADKVRVNFSSTPTGAEITLDGKYAGNTPSVIAVSPGTHDVVLSLPGFTQWKRELAVSVGSAVNVAAELKKLPR